MRGSDFKPCILPVGLLRHNSTVKVFFSFKTVTSVKRIKYLRAQKEASECFLFFMNSALAMVFHGKEWWRVTLFLSSLLLHGINCTPGLTTT